MHQRHVVDARQQPQLAHEPRGGLPDASFPLYRLDEHGRHAPRPFHDIGGEARALRLHEGARILVRPRQELVEGIHLPAIGVLALVGVR
jgi:hypothetical protein